LSTLKVLVTLILSLPWALSANTSSGVGPESTVSCSPAALVKSSDLQHALQTLSTQEAETGASTTDAFLTLTPTIHRTLRARSVPESNLDILTNEVLMRIWSHRKETRFDNDGAAVAYIAKLAENIVIDDYRTRKALKRGGENEPVSLNVSRGPLEEGRDFERSELGITDSSAESRFDAAQLRAAVNLAKMTSLQHDAIKLLLEGQTVAQISQILDISDGSAKSAVRQGRQALREFMELDIEDQITRGLSKGLSDREVQDLLQASPSRVATVVGRLKRRVVALSSQGNTEEEIQKMVLLPLYRIRGILDRAAIEHQTLEANQSPIPEANTIISQHQFEHALRNEDPRNREIMRSFYVLDLTEEAIAKDLNLTAGAIHRWLVLGRKKLQSELGLKLGPEQKLQLLRDEDFEKHFSVEPASISFSKHFDSLPTARPVEKTEPLEHKPSRTFTASDLQSALVRFQYLNQKQAERAKQVLRLIYLEGKSIDEVAKTLQRTKRSVQHILHKALEHLQPLLGSDAPLTPDSIIPAQRSTPVVLGRLLKERRAKALKEKYPISPKEFLRLIQEAFSNDARARDILESIFIKKEKSLSVAERLKMDRTILSDSVALYLSDLGKRKLGIEGLSRKTLAIEDFDQEKNSRLAQPAPFLSISEQEFDKAISTIDDPTKRAVLRMRLVYNWSRPDIVAITQLPPDRVTKLLTTGFVTLVKNLGRPEIDRLHFGVRASAETGVESK
jgi:RNA polymerase sigma factor (sigma-70 family)